MPITILNKSLDFEPYQKCFFFSEMNICLAGVFISDVWHDTLARCKPVRFSGDLDFDCQWKSFKLEDHCHNPFKFSQNSSVFAFEKKFDLDKICWCYSSSLQSLPNEKNHLMIIQLKFCVITKQLLIIWTISIIILIIILFALVLVFNEFFADKASYHKQFD